MATPRWSGLVLLFLAPVVAARAVGEVRVKGSVATLAAAANDVLAERKHAFGVNGRLEVETAFHPDLDLGLKVEHSSSRDFGSHSRDYWVPEAVLQYQALQEMHVNEGCLLAGVGNYVELWRHFFRE
ncbi:MAG: hypothetical protein Q4B13_11740 [Lautropia sp.]|nr:hypothetical protein [Lautropia sp.]